MRLEKTKRLLELAKADLKSGADQRALATAVTGLLQIAIEFDEMDHPDEEE